MSRALARLPKGAIREDVLVGLDARDDAAVIEPPPAGHVLIHTVDFFRSFISDPYEFGAVAANNALGVNLFPTCTLHEGLFSFWLPSAIQQVQEDILQ